MKIPTISEYTYYVLQQFIEMSYGNVVTIEGLYANRTKATIEMNRLNRTSNASTRYELTEAKAVL